MIGAGRHTGHWGRRRRMRTLSPFYHMLRCVRMSASRDEAKNLNRSKAVLPSVCGSRIFNFLGVHAVCNKIDRFRHVLVERPYLVTDPFSKVRSGRNNGRMIPVYHTLGHILEARILRILDDCLAAHVIDDLRASHAIGHCS